MILPDFGKVPSLESNLRISLWDTSDQQVQNLWFKNDFGLLYKPFQGRYFKYFEIDDFT